MRFSPHTKAMGYGYTAMRMIRSELGSFVGTYCGISASLLFPSNTTNIQLNDKSTPDLAKRTNSAGQIFQSPAKFQ